MILLQNQNTFQLGVKEVQIYSVVLLNLVCHATSLTNLSSCFIQEALQSIATDPGLYQMLPRFSTFISEGVSIFPCCFYLKHHFPCLKKKKKKS